MSVATVLLRDAEATLATDSLSLANASPLERAFVAWALQDEVVRASLAEIAASASSQTGALRSYRDVAVLGFATRSGLATVASEAIKTAIDWLVGTSALIDGVLTGVATDPLGLLGIAFAVDAIAGSAEATRARTWCGEFISRSGQAVRDWERPVVAVAARLLGHDASMGTEPEIGDVLLALHARGLRTTSDSEQADIEQVVLDQALTPRAPLDPVRSAFRLVAVRAVRSQRPTLTIARPTRKEVGALLRRVPNALQEWTWEERPRTTRGTARRWSIDHEYHVQNLLWALLVPLFPDLEREEYTPPVGPLQPRADLGIPSLRLLIEVKFWRATDPAQRIVTELAADENLYFANGGRYDDVIAFIWDDARRTEAHGLLARGLAAIEHVRDVIIVPRPGKMEERPLKGPARASQE